MRKRFIVSICFRCLLIVCFLHCGTVALIARGSNPLEESGLEASIKQLAKDIAGQMTQRNISKIAIDDFTDLNGRKSALGDFISEELVTNFYMTGSGSFDVVERRELARVMKEQKLQSTGSLDRTSIAKIGKLLGVEAIVTGSIASWGKAIKINARMIGVENARVFAAASKKVLSDPMIESLMNQSARSQGSSGGSSDVQIQRSDAFFQNKFLRIDPKAIHKNKKKDKVTVTLKFKNLLSKTLMLGLNRQAYPTLDCHNGEALTRYSISGIARVNDGKYTKMDQASSFGSGDETAVILTFESREPIESDTFSISINLLRFVDDGKFHRFSAGIPNLKL